MAASFAVGAIIHHARLQNSGQESLDPDPWGCIMQLCHVEAQTELFRENHAEALEIISNMLNLGSTKAAETLVPLNLFARIMAVLHMNTMTVFECSNLMSAKPIMTILPCVAAFFNHSCVPNIALVHPLRDDMAVFITTRAIEVGEELHICYTDPTQDYAKRSKHLEWAYGFSCNCPLCAAQEGHQA